MQRSRVDTETCTAPVPAPNLGVENYEPHCLFTQTRTVVALHSRNLPICLYSGGCLAWAPTCAAFEPCTIPNTHALSARSRRVTPRDYLWGDTPSLGDE